MPIPVLPTCRQVGALLLGPSVAASTLALCGLAPEPVGELILLSVVVAIGAAATWSLARVPAEPPSTKVDFYRPPYQAATLRVVREQGEDWTPPTVPTVGGGK